MARMKRNAKMKWNTRTLTFLAETLKQNNAHKHKEMSEDMAASASDALSWAADRIDDLERRLLKRDGDTRLP
jgi:hypothetical protein